MPSICEEGGGGLIFPLTSTEWKWSRTLTVPLYGVGLIYFFLGVSIVADMFMGAIEKITGTRAQTKDKATGRWKTGFLWNETVATLTLMALGSSAPEIFLSVIDMFKREFTFGALGPATIVGSAAFNLLVIVGVCILAIPSGEVRSIKNRPAFYITAAFSLFAYVWLAGIVTQSTPGIIDIWEAAVTLLMMPVLIYVSYKFDRGDADRIVQLFARFATVDREVSEEAAPTCLVRFECDRLMLRGLDRKTTVVVNVSRDRDHPEGMLSVGFRTEGYTAVGGYDFEEVEGRLEFEPGEMTKTISLEILAKPEWRACCKFLVVLEDPDFGMGLDEDCDCDEDASYLTVTIDRVASAHELTTELRLDRWLNFLHWRRGLDDWAEQMKGVFFANGSAEEQAEASGTDWVLHLISVPWKILFGWFPPPTFCGGWIAFLVSLCGIAGVTACISDLAEMFGCVVGMPDIVTAFTFVALGTSMPDLFASLTSAKEDPTADASVVNVTGSNSVNVYLGLGVPWTLAALYWKINGRTAEWEAMYPVEAAKIPAPGAAFVVEHLNMGFVVLTFCVLCILALIILHYRRKWLGGELGGSFASKMNTFMCFILMWLGWVALCSWRILRYRDDWGSEPLIVQGLSVVALLVGFCASTFHMKMVSVAFQRERAARLAEAANVSRNSRRSSLEFPNGGSSKEHSSEGDKHVADRSSD